MLEPRDIIDIQQLLSLYGHLVADQDWEGLEGLFTADAVFDASAVGTDRCDGRDAIMAMFRNGRQPLSVHLTNIVVQEIDGAVVARSKSMAVVRGGLTIAGAYRDVLVYDTGSWRISHRTATSIPGTYPSARFGD